MKSKWVLVFGCLLGCYLAIPYVLRMVEWSAPSSFVLSTEAGVTSLPVLAPTLLGQATSAGYQQLTGIDSTTAQAPTVPAGTHTMTIQAEDANLRMRDDGTNPTASVGFLIYAGDALTTGTSLAAVKVIATSGTAKANILYEK